MPSERLYYDDSYTTRFAARIVGHGAHQGRPAVELESTYFYPESGGQEADRGRIGDAPVIDVQAGDDGRVWHVVTPEAPAPEGGAQAEIDWTRRFDLMQQHTGQHVLSAAFERELGAATLSSHLGEERSSIELGLRTGDWRDVERVERAANAVIWDDREIVRHWVDDEGVKRFALRKPPKFSGRIRIVEIPDWDVSACGGTHTRRTGEVGLVKVVRWERVRDSVRFEFLCGGRALRDYAWRTESLLEAARRRTIHDSQLIEHLERAAAERDQLAKRARELATRLATTEAAERVARASGGVAEYRDAWPRDEARSFAFKCLELGAPWAAVAAAAPEPFVMLARPKGGAADLRALLPALLERARGKGGGSPDALQVAAADAGAARAAWEWARAELPGMCGRGDVGTPATPAPGEAS
jgi:alanyl-tRNA synthetase